MKRIFLKRLLLPAIGTMCLFFYTLPALAQDAGRVQELQQVIEAQQKQLDAQQKQLDAQRHLLQELQKQLQPLVKDAGGKETPAIVQKPGVLPEPAKARPQGVVGLSEADKRDRESPTGSNVTYFDTTRVVNIPGTNTDLGLHGLIQFQMFHDTNGLNNNRFDTATIPINGAPAQTKFSVNPTQIRLSSTTRVEENRLNTMLSMDFNGQLDRPEPRLRVAYGEYVNNDLGLGILGGQAYSTMNDLQAAPETLDFAGPAGMWQTRQPLLRFTKSLSKSMLTEFSAETPENVVYMNAQKLTRWPDFAAAGTWRFGGNYFKHIRLAGLARDLGAQGVSGATDSAFGWAVAGSTKVGLPFLGAKDSFKITVHYGDGYGTQVKGGPAEGAFNPATSSLETIGIFGTYSGLQHFWSDQWRSNLVYGHVNADNPEFVPGTTYDNTHYAAADLIWNPYQSLDVGIEYLWGRRENKDGSAGTSNRYLFSSRLKF